MSYAVIRLRGKHDLRHAVRDTMKMLHLTRQNHC
ncbi:MAG: uL30 family ribosomal protein, partial [Candidatus Thermoplasmatota archaeon]